MQSSELTAALQNNQDIVYQQMQIRLLPTLSPDTIIGVRTPILRKIASQLEDPDSFLHQLPHRYLEEDQIHAFLLEHQKDFDILIREVEHFLPYINNWVVCDQLRPKCFRTHKGTLLPYIHKWLKSPEPYTVRFAIEMLMLHYLDDSFSPQYLDLVCAVTCDEYYVKMMVAWYFATALAMHYEETLSVLSGYRLEKWIHNKTIQKAVESHRISPEHKAELITYRIK